MRLCEHASCTCTEVQCGKGLDQGRAFKYMARIRSPAAQPMQEEQSCCFREAHRPCTATLRRSRCLPCNHKGQVEGRLGRTRLCVLGLLPLLESGRMLRHRLAVELERKKAWMLRYPVGFDLKFASGWMALRSEL